MAVSTVWSTRAVPSRRITSTLSTPVATIVGPGTNDGSMSTSSGAATRLAPKPTAPCTAQPATITSAATTASRADTGAP